MEWQPIENLEKALKECIGERYFDKRHNFDVWVSGGNHLPCRITGCWLEKGKIMEWVNEPYGGGYEEEVTNATHFLLVKSPTGEDYNGN